MIKLKVLSLICLNPQFIQALNVSIGFKNLSKGFKNQLKVLNTISTITAFPMPHKLLNYLIATNSLLQYLHPIVFIEEKFQQPLIILFNRYLFAYYISGIVLDLGDAANKKNKIRYHYYLHGVYIVMEIFGKEIIQ